MSDDQVSDINNIRWRYYKTVAGHSPVRDYLDQLSQENVAKIRLAMKRVKALGIGVATTLKLVKHIRDDIYELRVHGETMNHRVLFAPEGKHEQILLALHSFSKTTRKTPLEEIRLAEKRLDDWRKRARPTTF